MRKQNWPSQRCHRQYMDLSLPPQIWSFPHVITDVYYGALSLIYVCLSFCLFNSNQNWPYILCMVVGGNSLPTNGAVAPTIGAKGGCGNW